MHDGYLCNHVWWNHGGIYGWIFYFGTFFDNCIHILSLVLQRYEEKKLVFNWEKCHFMIQNGIVLGHHVSKKKTGNG